LPASITISGLSGALGEAGQVSEVRLAVCIEIVSLRDRGDVPLAPYESGLERLGVRPVKAAGFLEMNLEARALLGQIVRWAPKADYGIEHVFLA